jgi:hypothetical protein
MQRQHLPLVIQHWRARRPRLRICRIMDELTKVDPDSRGWVKRDDLAGADRDLLRLAARMLNDRDPFAIDCFARQRDQWKPAVAVERYAVIRQRRNRHKGDIEFGVGIEYFMRTQVEADRIAQHAIDVVLVAELGLTLARLVFVAKHVMIGEQQSWSDQKTGAVPRPAVTRHSDPAHGRRCTLAPIQKIDRQQIAFADDTLERIGIAARRLEEILADSKTIICLGSAASFGAR